MPKVIFLNYAFKSFEFHSITPWQLIYFLFFLGELCCTNSCGGHTCYRSKSGPNSSQKSHSVCQDADNILKCVYDKIKKRVCAQDKEQKKNHWISYSKKRQKYVHRVIRFETKIFELDIVCKIGKSNNIETDKL